MLSEISDLINAQDILPISIKLFPVIDSLVFIQYSQGDKGEVLITMIVNSNTCVFQ